MTIHWTETVPSGTSLVGNAPTDFKSVWTAITTGMVVEHLWAASGGASDASSGDLLPGASRAFVAAQSASSAPTSQMTGRLFFASDTSRLFVYGSAATYLAGTPYCDLYSAAGNGAYWLRQTSFFTVSTSTGTRPITFPVRFVAAPTMVYQTGSETLLLGVISTSATDFVSRWSMKGAASTATIFWEAVGSTASY